MLNAESQAIRQFKTIKDILYRSHEALNFPWQSCQIVRLIDVCLFSQTLPLNGIGMCRVSGVDADAE